MTNEISKGIQKIIYAPEFERAFEKTSKKDQEMLKKLENQMDKAIHIPEIGKPLRYTLKNLRRLHIGSFVLVYEFHNNEIRFLDFDHHDKIYKKYK